MKDNKDCKILVVDDTPANIKVVTSILIEKDYDVYVANNGKKAVEYTRDHDFDLILLDIMMPEMDGLEVCRIIKKTPKSHDIPVIFLTAHKEIDSIVKGFEAGGVDYITKPFNKIELLVRVKNHLELKFAKDELKIANATKDTFFSIIAHDLKGPLTSISAMIDMALEDTSNFNHEELFSTLRLTERSINRLKSMLSNLLYWAQAQKDSLVYNYEKFDINSIINENTELLTESANKKNIIISSKVNEKTFVFADKESMRTVFRNLISNAIKFTPIGGQIDILSVNRDHYVELSVKDTGIGIKPENIEKIFDINRRWRTKGTEGEDGTGLGLFLCTEFVKKNGGELIVKSESGKGSSFIFTLPLPV